MSNPPASQPAPEGFAAGEHTVVFTRPVASLEEIQQGWYELKTRLAQLEAERAALEQENKTLRTLLERAIEHRQKSHSELVLLLSNLVSKLPINDVGVIISKLVEHNAQVAEMSALLSKGRVDQALPRPTALQELERTKRELTAALKTTVHELIHLQPPLETQMLESLVTNPDAFFAPAFVRAQRGFIKGQIPRERILREFGPEVLPFFKDMTTDPRQNPRPKPEEILLAFRDDFETLLQQDKTLAPEVKERLRALYQQVQQSKGSSQTARAQRIAFAKLSFLLELLHYYEHQNTESPEAVFAQRLPALVEQLALTGAQETLDETLLTEVESLLARILNPDHRLAVINNVGKAGGLARTLRFLLRLRLEKDDPPPPAVLVEVIPEFVRHLLPGDKPPAAAQLAPILRLLPAPMQKHVLRALRATERIPRPAAEKLVQDLAALLGVGELEEPALAPPPMPPEMERRRAWDEIRDLIRNHREPAAIAAAIRNRLHAHYDPEELREAWLALTEADVMTFIRVFCQLPYQSDGRADPIARAAMETFLNRLLHEKYAATYRKVVNSLKNLHHANPNSPTLLTCLTLVRWISPEAARKICSDAGITLPE